MACIGKKCYCKVVFRAIFCFLGSHIFSYRSLQLGTNVPNDSNFESYWNRSVEKGKTALETILCMWIDYLWS